MIMAWLLGISVVLNIIFGLVLGISWYVIGQVQGERETALREWNRFEVRFWNLRAKVEEKLDVKVKFTGFRTDYEEVQVEKKSNQ